MEEMSELPMMPLLLDADIKRHFMIFSLPKIEILKVNILGAREMHHGAYDFTWKYDFRILEEC